MTKEEKQRWRDFCALWMLTWGGAAVKDWYDSDEQVFNTARHIDTSKYTKADNDFVNSLFKVSGPWVKLSPKGLELIRGEQNERS